MEIEMGLETKKELRIELRVLFPSKKLMGMLG